MQILSFVICLVLLGSCDGLDRLKLLGDSYVGYKQSNLIESFGKPKDITYIGPEKVLEFRFVEHFFNLSPFDPQNPNNPANDPRFNNPGVNSPLANPNLNNSIVNGGIRSNGRGDVSFRYGELQGAYSRKECNLRFTVDSNDLVKNWNYTGNNCLAYATRANLNRQYLRDLPGIIDKTYGLKLKNSSKGLRVKSVHPLSSAAQLGLLEGDTITKINDLVTRNLTEISALVELSKYAQVKLEVLRGKEIMSFNVKKSDIPRLDLFNKKERKFMGFR